MRPLRGGAGRGDARLYQWLLPLLGLILAGLVLLPSAGAQGVCGQAPTSPHCAEPTVDVTLPGNASVPLEAVEGGNGSTVRLPVDVTYEADNTAPNEQSNVTVEAGPGGPFPGSGGAATVAPGETVSIDVTMEVPPEARAGDHAVPLFVNTSATDTQTSTSQAIETTLRVPWVLGSSWQTLVPRLDVVGEDVVMTFRVEDLPVNGPVDLLVTSETVAVEPRIHEAAADWAPDPPLVQEWNVTFQGGAEEAFGWELWPVVPTGGGHACIVGDTGELAPLEGGNPSPTCLRAGSGSVDAASGSGALDTIVLVALTLVLLGMVGAGLLGVFVLRRGGSDPPPRALGTYLLLAAPGFGLLAFREVTGRLFGYGVADTVVPGWTTSAIFATMAFLPAAILTFAVSYPTLHPRLRGTRWWPAIPIGPSAALAGYTLLSFLLDPGPNQMPLRRGIPLLGSLVLAGAASSVLFRRRAQRATTDLERRRLSFMFRWVALPLTLVAALMGATYVLDVLAPVPGWVGAMIFLLFAVVALFPVTAMAWGLLKYEVVDLDEKLEFTVSRGFVASVFIALFFVVSEAAATFLSDAVGPYVGLLAAGLLVLVLAPLERVGQQLASQVTGDRSDEAEYRRFRRLEVYRATYEEATADGTLTGRERDTLDSLAGQLGLTDEEVDLVESEVRRERGSADAAPEGTAPAGA